MIRLLLSAVAVTVGAKSLASIETPPPKGCEWQLQPLELETTESVVDPVLLYCRIGTIGDAESLIASLPRTQADRVATLILECSHVSFFESYLTSIKRGGALSSLSRLEELRLDKCKIRNIPQTALSPFGQLRRLSVRSHNSEWPAMTLEFHPEGFRGMAELRSLDLAHNNIRSTPPNLFCPLYSLTHLNLTRNRLQDVSALGFSDWGNGPAPSSPSRGCANRLKVLDISHNDIISLPHNGFFSLPSLDELRLENNAISAVADRAFFGLSALTTLNLSGNRLIALPPELFQSSSSYLRHLYLHNNSLSVLARGLLQGLDQLVVLDLSRNELTSPRLHRHAFSDLAWLLSLNLAHNQLTRIDADLFLGLYNLQTLNLKHNHINDIADGAFSELKNLRVLVLTQNKMARIESHHLVGVYALNELLLDSNEIEHIYPEAFEKMTDLRHLSLNENRLDGVPVGVGQLKFLRTLDLGNNRIEHVSKTSFEGLDLLVGLRLVGNRIGNVSRDAFSTLPSLRVLNLASAEIKYVERNAFSSTPTLTNVRLDGNELTDISDVFADLQNLVWLNVSSNKLLRFDFRDLPASVELVDLHDNQITELKGNNRDDLTIKLLDVSYNSITTINENSVPDSVRTLLLNDNKIRTVQPNTFFNKTNLEKVVLCGNDMKYLDPAAVSLSPATHDKDLPQFYVGGNPFYCDCNMDWLLDDTIHLATSRRYPQMSDLDAVTCELAHFRGAGGGAPPPPLSSLNPSHFLCPYENHCFALCLCCDLDACKCQMTCPDKCKCYHDYTWRSNVVDCGSARYTNVPENLPPDATEIYLDGNDLGEFGDRAFVDKRNLEALFLNGSNVKAVRNATFDGVKSLKVLHLENNKLKELRGFEFDQLEDLNELYLDRNEIAYVGRRTFTNLRNLEVLTLDYNKLVDFAPWQMATQARVSLDGNKWSCDCNSLGRLLGWIRDAGGDPPKMYCAEQGNDSETVADAIKHRCADMDEAIATTAVVERRETLTSGRLIGGLLATVLVVCFIVAATFLFRRRIRQYARCGLDAAGDTTNDDDDERDRLYDGYMVYSSEDADDLAARVIAPELEQYGHTMCLHYRDLHMMSDADASYLAEAMAAATYASRRVVLVVSPGLVCTEWARPEFRAALRGALGTSYKHKLVCVLSGQPLEPMDTELRALLCARAVTRWGERRFWDKLSYAMPDVMMNNQATRRNKKRPPHHHHHHHY